MPFLFWTLWVINLLLLALATVGKGYRSSFGAGIDFNVVMILGLLIVLVSSLVLRFAVKQKAISLVVVSIPLLVVLAMYIYEKMTGKTI